MSPWVIIYISAAALSILLCGIIIPKILLIAFRKKLFDQPNPRKIHHGTVPRLGGFAFTPVVIIVMAFIIGVLGRFAPGFYSSIAAFSSVTACMGICALLVMYLVGMADDLIGVRYRAKFVVEVMCSMLLLVGGLGIRNFDGVLMLHGITPWIGFPFTVLAVIFVINSINLIDGIDGLASGLSAITFVVYGIIFAVLDEYFYATLSFSVLGVLVPFFYFNVFGNAARQKKIFMGDTGSLTIGIFIVILGLRLWQLPNCKIDNGLPNYFIVILSPLIIPCFDVVRVFAFRLRMRHNPFMPDCNHIHHKLLATGMKQRAAMISIVAVSMAICVGNTALSYVLNVNCILLIDIVGLTLWNRCLNRRILRRGSGKDEAAYTQA